MLTPGAQLGPYRIEGLIGAGGMGRVLRAVDTRLNRSVAIKTCDPQFSARFRREAQSISSLNHPHICTLYDIGPDYLVLELVEGQTLAARLNRGKLTLDETLAYGAQIAAALAAAHARGIIHRDLKPANVMLGKNGVKVLDFGLAKAPENETVTLAGAVMGTPAYMAPEQREGKECDARTDIYALGLVLYEMATGKRPAQGLPVTLPASPELQHVVELCLPVDPEERWHSAADVRKELEWAAKAPPANRTPAPTNRLWPALAALLAVLSAGLAATLLLSRSAPERPVQFRMTVEHGGSDPNDTPRISPDGSALAYAARNASGEQLIWVRSLGSVDAQPIAGTADAIRPFWSPDGGWIGFYSQGKLKKVRRDGGPPQIIAALPGFDTATWGAGGEILLNLGNRSALYRIRDSGGEPRQVTKLDASRSENSHRYPRFLPDGRRFLFVARCSDRQNNAVYMGTLDTGESRRLGPISSNVAYMPARSGRPSSLAFVRDGTLYIQRFRDAALIGEPEVAVKDVFYSSISTFAAFDVSQDGRVLVFHPQVDDRSQLQWFSRSGVVLASPGPPGTFYEPRLSPDEKQVIYSRPDDNGGNRDLWLTDTSRGTTSRLTLTKANEWAPVWSPDGRRIVFSSDRDDNPQGRMYEKTSLEAGVGEMLATQAAGVSNPFSWSADGRWVAFVGRTGVSVLPMFGERKPFTYLLNTFDNRDPRFSPDGKWIAYHSNESGRFEVYMRSFAGVPAGPDKTQISERGGYFPAWRGDSKELFFIGADSILYSTSIDTGGAVSKPGALFPVCPGNTPTGSATQAVQYDVAHDGRRFLFVCASELLGRYTVIVNWTPAPR